MTNVAASPFVPRLPTVLPDERGQDRAMLEAALAVNEATSLDQALAILAETMQDLLAAHRASVIVWDDGLTRGVVRAASGWGDGVGEVVVVRDEYAGPLREGQPFVVSDEMIRACASEERARVMTGFGSYVSVPFRPQGGPPLSLQAAWRRPRSEEELGAAVSVIRTLGLLTRLAFRADEERREQRNRAYVDAVIESLGEGVWLESGGQVTLNAAARELLGREDIPEPETWPPLRGLDGRALEPDERPAAVARRTRAPHPFRVWVTRADGSERLVAGTAAPILGGGEVVGVVCAFRDSTDEYLREELTMHLLEKLFDNLPIAIVVTDLATREILSVNPAFGDLVGYEAPEIIGARPPFEWWASEPEAFEGIEWGPQQGAARLEALFRHKDGLLIPVELVRFSIGDGLGRPEAAVALITDLSERHRFQQQLLDSAKLAAVGELAAGVAHEINNPLFAILGLVEFLLRDAASGTKSRERLELVQQTGLEIKEIVRALLDFAREKGDDAGPTLVREAAAQTVELVRRTSAAKGIELVEVYDEEPTVVEANPSRLKQVFLNLITNAIQAMPEGGAITVDVRTEGRFVVASVTDTGPGIPADLRTRIFEPFFTTKGRRGSGLGLAVSRSIADAHGGDLWVECPPEGGTRFVFRLPAREAS